jgi:hypothetical protein
MVHAVLVVVALAALLCLPCLLAALITADRLVERVQQSVCGIGTRWRSWRREAMLRRLTGLDRHHLLHRHGHRSAEAPAGPPIEVVAADLRRLGRQRSGAASSSPFWFAAVERAYDERLVLACRELEIPQYLGELTGLDLDIERVRVEGQLEASGVRLAVLDIDRRQDFR